MMNSRRLCATSSDKVQPFQLFELVRKMFSVLIIINVCDTVNRKYLVSIHFGTYLLQWRRHNWMKYATPMLLLVFK